jgi:hypothetical protein
MTSGSGLLKGYRWDGVDGSVEKIRKLKTVGFRFLVVMARIQRSRMLAYKCLLD